MFLRLFNDLKPEGALAQLVARRSHNPKVVSSILTGPIFEVCVICRDIILVFNQLHSAGFRDSIVVSISACHADDPGSIPGRGAILSGLRRNKNLRGRVEIIQTVNGAMAQR